MWEEQPPSACMTIEQCLQPFAVLNSDAQLEVCRGDQSAEQQAKKTAIDAEAKAQADAAAAKTKAEDDVSGVDLEPAICTTSSSI